MDIPTRYIIPRTAYLTPSKGAVPETALPPGVVAHDSFETLWLPLSGTPDRQAFRIQAKELVFIAGAQYHYRPNTTLYLQCKRAIFLPHPTQPGPSVPVVFHLPGADATQNPPAKPELANKGVDARIEIEEGRPVWYSPKVPRFKEGSGRGAGAGAAGAAGATGARGADAGSLILRADEIDTSRLAAGSEERTFFVARCGGGRGGRGGPGGDGGDGGWGLSSSYDNETTYRMSEDLRAAFEGHHFDNVSRCPLPRDREYATLVQSTFLGGPGGAPGTPGAGGFGGDGGRLEVQCKDDRARARFAVYSTIGIPGDNGPPGAPGATGACGDSKLMTCLKSTVQSDYMSIFTYLCGILGHEHNDLMRQWAGYVGKGEQPPSRPTAGYNPLDEVAARRAAGQRDPLSSPDVVLGI
ncbi:hypothetical protein ASPZODRAFT_1313495 [Penicilliopsis zonata CBS 506.65]|uniref:Uncharacterized protein n=1 Tax=Penicilliopsis zonata CBS 506.65 TaxID=1073090 RepID=A0A1L9S5E0_9EURO|nr:hypothetical protein ASPZODRAFT_1313495 [Penicilliopsis zonata CBS 506.65]OJJ42375.1 hypothetical protein ASPZODRAFT_1313495 [Penicilliopsis zonata CBS 506.65]